MKDGKGRGGPAAMKRDSGLALRSSSHPKGRTSEGGFTLIELIVVIAIITILMALLAVFIVGVKDRAANAKAKAIVDGLDKACQTYRLEYNIYPPNNKGDSRCLHFYLGQERMVSKGLVEGGPSLMVRTPPIIEFPTDWLKLVKMPPDPKNDPVPIIDPWENLVRYLVPGNYNKKGVDIWSPGKNGLDDLVGPGEDTDDLANWIKEY
jgi:prepilin-type N-terminal cleavage/methylation domain-containing protein